jgi:hypothetical protein
MSDEPSTADNKTASAPRPGCKERLVSPLLAAVIAILGLAIACLALLGAFLVPEVRDLFGLDPTATPLPTATATPIPTPTSEPTSTPRTGTWRCPTDSEMDGASYVASDESDKFHCLDCEWAEKISPRNRLCFGSYEAAINAGFAPCQVCEPP